MSIVRREAERWISSGDRDLRAAEFLLSRSFYSHSVFYSHLSVEKFLKASMIEATGNATPPYSHNLPYLAGLAQMGMSEEALEFLAILSPHNIAARYYDDDITYTENFSREIFERSTEVAAWLRQQLT